MNENLMTLISLKDEQSFTYLLAHCKHTFSQHILMLYYPYPASSDENSSDYKQTRKLSLAV